VGAAPRSEATLPVRVARSTTWPGVGRASVACPSPSVCAVIPPPATVAPASAVGVVVAPSVRCSRTVTVNGCCAVTVAGTPASVRGNTVGFEAASSRCTSTRIRSPGLTVYAQMPCCEYVSLIQRFQ
jgi:hypothetical protein